MSPHDPVASLPLWHAALVLGPALAYALAALAAGPATRAEAAWRLARRAASAALGLAALSLLAVASGSHGSAFGVRADAVGGVVVLLVTFLGWVVVRYSGTCLDGERRSRHGMRWLAATLAAVALVVASNHLLLMALAWTGTSLALHRLLTFFPERPQAVLAAHKKFLVGRAADVCMLAAAWLLFHAFGTLHLDELASQATAAPLPGTAQAAVVLVAGAALLKCAQLPFHGWLIQVMEAPTPVSALLHAGIVNLGGFVLVRIAPLLAEVPAAQALLVVAGTATAVLAALVATTRISIKVALAWSTCAQMGFMLLQCGLGLWQMALLHLLAHSLYKAHAFLGAGGAVRRAMLAELAPRAQPPGAGALAFGAAVGVAMTLAAGALVDRLAAGPVAPAPVWVMSGIVALALVPLVQARALRLGGPWLPALAAGAFGVALAYAGLHAVLPAALDAGTSAGTVPAPLWIGVALAFGTLFLVQSALTVAPHGALSMRLHPWFYGGLFLDEGFTRLAFRAFPPPAPESALTPLPTADGGAAPAPAAPTTTTPATPTAGARA